MSHLELKSYIKSLNYEKGGQTNEIFNWSSHLFGAFSVIYHVTNKIQRTNSIEIRIALSIYLLTSCLMLFGSVLHHGVGIALAPSLKIYNILRMFDHLSIFLVIVGTVIPFATQVTPGLKTFVIVSDSVIMVLGLSLKLIYKHNISQKIFNIFYLLTGWSGTLLMRQLSVKYGKRVFWLLLISGLSFTFGTYFQQLQCPSYIKNWFGAHEIWHCMVLFGTLTLLYCVLSFVH